MTIYVFGNPFVKGDDAVFPITDSLKKLFPGIVFRITDPNEDFPPSGELNPIILDTVQGIPDVALLQYSDLQIIEKSPVSPHDYDLLMHLLLLKKMGKIQTITILGIPFRKDDGRTLDKVKRLISSLLSGNEKHRTCTDQTHG